MFLVSLFVYFFTFNIGISQECRDRNTWPFSSESIWNMPIGSNAQFMTSNIFIGTQKYPLPNNFFGDVDFYFNVTDKDPVFPWYNQGHWGSGSYCNITGNFVGNIHFPSNIIIDNFGNNNAAAILQPDNITLLQMQPLYHCNNTSPILALSWGLKQNVSILGDGIFGCHGGSGLSSIGGTIRKGELTTNIQDYTTMKHALKLEFLANEYYYGGYEYPCYRWPASDCDGYHHDNSSKLVYNGTNEYFTPGTLLGIPTNDTTKNILDNKLKTYPGKKIMWTLMNYGGYIVDDTAVNRGTICVEYGVTDEFEETYNESFNAKKGSTFYDDLLIIFQSLKIIKNNDVNNVGGGGTPIQPISPPICT
mmetsp:Transcript_96404/g.118151  ORF Transcript_96404/g.118151 Transcript_96404/m.118151 type:complete len:362 (-) Transcript_96404:1067-2152(-)